MTSSTARTKLVEVAKDAGIGLKQTYAKEAAQLSRKAGRYAHARQFKRMKGAIKSQRTTVGRLQREIERQIERKASTIGLAVQEALGQTIHDTLNKAKRIWSQSARRKTVSGQPNLYSWHAPEVDCISKGKARIPYEFGTNVGIASTLKGNLIVGAIGDKLHAVLGAAGYNIQWLLRMIAKKGGDFLEQALFAPAKVGVFDVAQCVERAQTQSKQSGLRLKMNKSVSTLSPLDQRRRMTHPAQLNHITCFQSFHEFHHLRWPQPDHHEKSQQNSR